jgi:hypothetical protein
MSVMENHIKPPITRATNRKNKKLTSFTEICSPAIQENEVWSATITKDYPDFNFQIKTNMAYTCYE